MAQGALLGPRGAMAILGGGSEGPGGGARETKGGLGEPIWGHGANTAQSTNHLFLLLFHYGGSLGAKGGPRGGQGRPKRAKGH